MYKGSLKICFKWTLPFVFPIIIKSAAYMGKDATTNICILKRKANFLTVKGLYHRGLYSKACNLTLNGISKIL